jgi:hypothetical protein
MYFLLSHEKNPFKGRERKLKNVTRMRAERGCFVSTPKSVRYQTTQQRISQSKQFGFWTRSSDLFHRLRPNTILTMDSSVNNRDPGVAAGHLRDNISTHSVLNYSSISFHSLGPSTVRVTSLAILTLQHPSERTCNQQCSATVTLCKLGKHNA